MNKNPLQFKNLTPVINWKEKITSKCMVHGTHYFIISELQKSYRCTCGLLVPVCIVKDLTKSKDKFDLNGWEKVSDGCYVNLGLDNRIWTFQ